MPSASTQRSSVFSPGTSSGSTRKSTSIVTRPSELFRRQIYVDFWYERAGIELVPQLEKAALRFGQRALHLARIELENVAPLLTGHARRDRLDRLAQAGLGVGGLPVAGRCEKRRGGEDGHHQEEPYQSSNTPEPAAPSALFYSVLPMFRAYARFGVVVQLMAVRLAGIGVNSTRRNVVLLGESAAHAKQLGTSSLPQPLEKAVSAVVGKDLVVVIPDDGHGGVWTPSATGRPMATDGPSPAIASCGAPWSTCATTARSPGRTGTMFGGW